MELIIAILEYAEEKVHPNCNTGEILPMIEG